MTNTPKKYAECAGYSPEQIAAHEKLLQLAGELDFSKHKPEMLEALKTLGYHNMRMEDVAIFAPVENEVYTARIIPQNCKKEALAKVTNR